MKNWNISSLLFNWTNLFIFQSCFRSILDGTFLGYEWECNLGSVLIKSLNQSSWLLLNPRSRIVFVPRRTKCHSITNCRLTSHWMCLCIVSKSIKEETSNVRTRRYLDSCVRTWYKEMDRWIPVNITVNGQFVRWQSYFQVSHSLHAWTSRPSTEQQKWEERVMARIRITETTESNRLPFGFRVGYFIAPASNRWYFRVSWLIDGM